MFISLINDDLSSLKHIDVKLSKMRKSESFYLRKSESYDIE